MYVVYWCERLRDGTDEGAKVLNSIEGVQELVKQLSRHIGYSNTTIRLFKLGEEIPLTVEKVLEPQPPKETGLKVTIGDPTAPSGVGVMRVM